MPQVDSFKDLSITFKKHPVTNDLVTVKDTSAIAQAIKSILLTRKGERPFKPEFGSGLQNALFAPLDYATSNMIKGEITSCLGRYEPRVLIKRIICTPDAQNNGYNVELEFKVKGRNDRPVAVDFFLERAR